MGYKMDVRRALVVTMGLWLSACSSSGQVFDAPERAPSDRTPLTARCDAVDPTRCHLPWPSSSFLVPDDETLTGVRQHLDPDTYPVLDDDGSSFSQADGFSRISPLIVGTEGLLGALGDDALRVFVAEPDHPLHGQTIPLRVEVQTDETLGESFVVGYPRRPMPENAAMVAVAMKADGLEATPETELALGLREPTSQQEADRRGYHAPTRALLEEVGVAADDVARVWDFVTRSSEATVRPLLDMREAVLAASQDASFAIDEVEIASKPGVAMIVEGSVEMPWYVTDSLPDLSQQQTHVAPFRVVVPEGSGDYPVVLFGHGLGGTFDDPAFDEALAAEGLGKLGVAFHGWTVDTFLDTLGGFIRPYGGSAAASTMMLQALAELSALQQALSGPLGDVLAAAEIGGVANPAADRRPDMSTGLYGGGSLGGSVGFIYANMEPSIDYAALNVGGGGWSHFLRSSVFFSPLDALMRIDLGSPLDVTLVVAQAQTNMDYMDGAAWADHRDMPPVLLMQESIGDPVLPNIGTELMALSSGAVRVGEALVPFGDLEQVDVATEQTAITQFEVTGDATYVHGFAITDTEAGVAAKDQIRHFYASALAGQSEMVVPSQCAADRCDFSE